MVYNFQGMVPISFYRLTKLAAIFLCAAILSACTTHYGAAILKSNPADAEVYDMEDGSFIGFTTVKHLWRSRDTKRKFMNVRLQKEGYEVTNHTFWLDLKHTNKTSALNDAQLVEFDLKPSD